MNETILSKSKRKAIADYKAIADQLLRDLNTLDELMRKDRAEIEYLKAESARLGAENRAVLSRLMAAW